MPFVRSSRILAKDQMLPCRAVDSPRTNRIKPQLMKVRLQIRAAKREGAWGIVRLLLGKEAALKAANSDRLRRARERRAA